MNTRVVAIPAIAAVLIALGCNNERDPANIKLEQAYALPITGVMGDVVEPDRFQIYVSAFEDGHHDVKRGDTFRASLNIGTPANISKYGGVSGLRFTIQADGVQGGIPGTAIKWTVYPAVSEGLEISCDAQNRLRFTVSGEPIDNIELHIKTAAMRDQWIVWQNGHPGLSSLGLTGPNVQRTVRYHCLTERQP